MPGRRAETGPACKATQPHLGLSSKHPVVCAAALRTGLLAVSELVGGPHDMDNGFDRLQAGGKRDDVDALGTGAWGSAGCVLPPSRWPTVGQCMCASGTP